MGYLKPSSDNKSTSKHTPILRMLANFLAADIAQKATAAYAKKAVLTALPKEHEAAFKILAKKIKDSGVKLVTGATRSPIAYWPGSNEITIPGKTVPVGILAHEFGHALNTDTITKKFGPKVNKFWDRLYGLGNLASIAGLTSSAAASVANVDDDTVRNIGLIGTAAHVPMLTEELTASIRGANQLKKLKLPGKLKAFSGIPTYLASAALPMLPWGLRKAEPSLDEFIKFVKGE